MDKIQGTYNPPKKKEKSDSWTLIPPTPGNFLLKGSKISGFLCSNNSSNRWDAWRDLWFQVCPWPVCVSPMFQVFVASPHKTQPIVEILLENSTQTHRVSEQLPKGKGPTMEQFTDEKNYLIKQIRDLKKASLKAPPRDSCHCRRLVYSARVTSVISESSHSWKASGGACFSLNLSFRVGGI